MSTMSKGMNSLYPPSAIRYPLIAACALAIVACAPKGDALYARAEKSLGSGEVNAAIIDLKNLVKDEPGNAKARALLANALVQNGEISAAAIEVQKAKELGAPADTLLLADCAVMVARSEFTQVLEKCKPDGAPDSARAQLQIDYGRALLGLERAAEAKPQFEAALATRPDSLEALLGVASVTYALEGLPAAKALMDKASPAIQKRSAYWMAVGGINNEGGDLAAAEVAYQKAVDTLAAGADAGQRLVALGALAEAQMRQGKVKEAKATAEQLGKVAPNNPLVKQLKGQVAAAGGNLDEARTLLEEAVAAMPDNQQARLLLGLVNMQQGKLGQAEMHFASVVAKEPGNVEAQRQLTQVRAQLRSPAESLEGLKPALTDATTDPALLTMASRLSMASGDRKQALSYLAQAASQPKGGQTPEMQLEIAGGYMMAGDFDSAIKLLESVPDSAATGNQREYLLMAAMLRNGEKERAVAEANALAARNPKDPAVRNLVAGVLLAAGQPDAARAQLAEALAIKPDHVQTLTNLGRMDMALGKPVEADKNFRKVLAVDPKNIVATLGVAVAAAARNDNVEAEKWLRKAATDHPDNVQAQLALAQYYGSQQDLPKARAVIDEALKQSPDNATLLHARGLAQIGAGDASGAVASLKRAVELAPRNASYALNLARAYMAGNDMKSALEVLDGVLKADPGHVPALAMAAAGSLRTGNVERAAGYVERVRKIVPDSPGTYMLEGDLAMAQKRYADAVVSYRKASDKAGSTTRELVLAEFQAATLAGESRPERGLEDWVAKHPDDTAVVTALGEVRHRDGDSAGAIKLYEQALQKAPDNAPLLNNLAVLYQDARDPRALTTAERAYQLAPQIPAVQDTYGWILVGAGKAKESVEILEKAVNSMPGSAEVQYHYAAALAAAGRSQDAVPVLKKALAGRLPESDRAAAQALLEKLNN
jgi:putative PEP-CTERM system TPR-repeat lipoprotein